MSLSLRSMRCSRNANHYLHRRVGIYFRTHWNASWLEVAGRSRVAVEEVGQTLADLIGGTRL